ncbi:MAG: hypothetical protein HZY75_04240 [Nocardioidaceae bacterium]|nr:MAG: hypothetical protein HZY75_04240 [Nocardioidaceae bacterium]
MSSTSMESSGLVPVVLMLTASSVNVADNVGWTTTRTRSLRAFRCPVETRRIDVVVKSGEVSE